MTRDKLAALAEIVFEAAASDEVAAQVLRQGAIALADCVTCVGYKLGFARSEYILGVTGGVILSQQRYRDAVLESLSERGYQPLRIEIVTQPVVGALLIARQIELS